MRSILYTFAAFALLSSCAFMNGVAPELEEIHLKKGKTVGGVVVYNPLGSKAFVDRRRESALSRIRRVCHPNPYKISKEETSLVKDKKKDYNPDHIKFFTGQKLRFVTFECVRP